MTTKDSNENTAAATLPWSVSANPYRGGIKEAVATGSTSEVVPRRFEASVDPHIMLPEDACGEWQAEVYAEETGDEREPWDAFGEYTGSLDDGCRAAEKAIADFLAGASS